MNGSVNFIVRRGNKTKRLQSIFLRTDKRT